MKKLKAWYDLTFLFLCSQRRTATPIKLISSERPFKILQPETKVVKICQAVLEIFRTIDCVTSQMINSQLNNKQFGVSQLFAFIYPPPPDAYQNLKF